MESNTSHFIHFPSPRPSWDSGQSVERGLPGWAGEGVGPVWTRGRSGCLALVLTATSILLAAFISLTVHLASGMETEAVTLRTTAGAGSTAAGGVRLITVKVGALSSLFLCTYHH